MSKAPSPLQYMFWDKMCKTHTSDLAGNNELQILSMCFPKRATAGTLGLLPLMDIFILSCLCCAFLLSPFHRKGRAVLWTHMVIWELRPLPLSVTTKNNLIFNTMFNTAFLCRSAGSLRIAKFWYFLSKSENVKTWLSRVRDEACPNPCLPAPATAVTFAFHAPSISSS